LRTVIFSIVRRRRGLTSVIEVSRLGVEEKHPNAGSPKDRLLAPIANAHTVEAVRFTLDSQQSVASPSPRDRKLVIASQICWIEPPFSRLRLAWLHPTLDQVCPRRVARQIEAGAPTYVFVSTN